MTRLRLLVTAGVTGAFVAGTLKIIDSIVSFRRKRKAETEDRQERNEYKTFPTPSNSFAAR